MKFNEWEKKVFFWVVHLFLLVLLFKSMAYLDTLCTMEVGRELDKLCFTIGGFKNMNYTIPFPSSISWHWCKSFPKDRKVDTAWHLEFLYRFPHYLPLPPSKSHFTFASNSEPGPTNWFKWGGRKNIEFRFGKSEFWFNSAVNWPSYIRKENSSWAWGCALLTWMDCKL